MRARRTPIALAMVVLAGLAGLAELVGLAACQRVLDLRDVTYDAGADVGGVPAASCTDNQRNGDESDVDCGGGCGQCGEGRACGIDGDCTSQVCTGNQCQASTCTDEIKNGSESDIDCGGSCAPCGEGRACGDRDDCTSQVCTSNQCQASTCTDEIKNGSESDIDCGGSCAPCGDGKNCGDRDDCSSRVCTGNQCQAATCTDEIKNGSESDVDCGGGGCPACGTGKVCGISDDCASRRCLGAQCQAPTCTDQIKNGSESDVDCGGSGCPACGTGKVCGIADDCTSRVCTGSQCQAPTCTDQVRNGSESDVDCGGGACPQCGFGKACGGNDSDCADAGICEGRVCRPGLTCDEILRHRPGQADGVFRLGVRGLPGSYPAVCDMTRDGGGWTLLLKATGDGDLSFGVPAWTDDVVRNAGDLTTRPGNAKYQAFVSMPLTVLRGELDGFRFGFSVPAGTAQQLFNGPSLLVTPYPFFHDGPLWSTQPNCQTFGINIPYGARVRFGWSANQENNCDTNDTAIGFGSGLLGAGYACQSTECSRGQVIAGGDGLIWGK